MSELTDWVLVDEMHVSIKALNRCTADASSHEDRRVAASSAALALAHWARIEQLRSRLIAGDLLDGLREVADGLGERADGQIGLLRGGVADGLAGVTRGASRLVDGGGHDSPSVETSRGGANTAVEVDDTVGARPDTGSASSVRGPVSGIEITITAPRGSAEEIAADVVWRLRGFGDVFGSAAASSPRGGPGVW